MGRAGRTNGADAFFGGPVQARSTIDSFQSRVQIRPFLFLFLSLSLPPSRILVGFFQDSQLVFSEIYGHLSYSFLSLFISSFFFSYLTSIHKSSVSFLKILWDCLSQQAPGRFPLAQLRTLRTSHQTRQMKCEMFRAHSLLLLLRLFMTN